MQGPKTFDVTGDDRYVQDRPIQAWTPCPCGCDQRNDPYLLGYFHGITNGRGFTVPIYDKKLWERIVEVAKSQGFPIG